MKSDTMKSMLENLINGNISDAKKQAKRFCYEKIAFYAVENGYPKPYAMAMYLKGLISFQEYCDI